MTEMGAGATERTPPPYAPYRSWKNLLEKLRKEQPLPRQLDSSFWTRLRFSGALISVLKPTMVKLGLLTGDMEPTALLGELLGASGEREAAVYSSLMDIAYPDYYEQLDIDRMTDGELTQYFMSMGAHGETGQKARTFFLGLAKDAQKTLSSRVATRTHRGASQSRQAPAKRRRAQPDSRDTAPLAKGGGVAPGGDTAPARESLMLWGLFTRLPKPGSVFSQREREAWLEVAKTVFNLEYKHDGEQEQKRLL